MNTASLEERLDVINDSLRRVADSIDRLTAATSENDTNSILSDFMDMLSELIHGDGETNGVVGTGGDYVKYKFIRTADINRD